MENGGVKHVEELVTGSRRSTRINGRPEKANAALEQEGREIADLRDRAQRLEDRQSQ